jgi:hypothetical protein
MATEKLSAAFNETFTHQFVKTKAGREKNSKFIDV